MGLLTILFLHLIGYMFVVLLVAMWLGLQAAIIRNFGIFGICLVSAIYTIGPILLIAAIVG